MYVWLASHVIEKHSSEVYWEQLVISCNKNKKITKRDNEFINITFRCVHVTTVAVEKHYLHCMSVALVILYTMCMCCVTLSSVPCLALPHYLINGTLSGEMLLNKRCVFWFSMQLLSNTFLILRRIWHDIINVLRSSCEVPVLLVRF